MINKFIEIPPYIWGVITFLLILFTSIALEQWKLVSIKKEIDLLTLAGIPLFVVTVIGLAKSHRVKAAGLVRDHISGFLLNRELYSSFHELIYGYDDSSWKEVKKALPGELSRDEKDKTPEMSQKSWAALFFINSDKEEGKRYFDPDFFQGSLEEQRLDAVLHYFDMLAYNQQRKLISVEDITGASGYHLAVIGSREIVGHYLKKIEQDWDKLPYHERIGAEEPYDSLRKLLKQIKEKNKKKLAHQLLKKGLNNDEIKCRFFGS